MTVGIGGIAGRRSEWESDDVPAIPAVGMVVVCLPDTEQRHHGDQNDVEATPSHFGFTQVFWVKCIKSFSDRQCFFAEACIKNGKIGLQTGIGLLCR